MPPGFPEAYYLLSANNPQNQVYRSESNLSQIIIRAHRGGVLALLDHIHLIASQDVQGYILFNKTTGQCQTDLFIPLHKLIVDDPNLRLAADLDISSSFSSVENTKKNMLENIDADRFPFAQLHSDDCFNALSGNQSEVTLTVHGVQQTRHLASFLFCRQTSLSHPFLFLTG